MRIVFWGNGERGRCCLQALVAEFGPPVAVVAHADGDESAFAAAAGHVAVLSPKDPNGEPFRRRLRALSPDVFVLAGYGPILSAATLRLPRLGTINLHGGKLPDYRGSSPMNWALINGETSFSLSVIMADIGVDKGDILVEQSFPIAIDDTIATLHEIANRQFPEMMVTALKAIATGAVLRRVQDGRTGRYWPLRFPEDGHILFDQFTAEQVHNRIRALTEPYPCAFTIFQRRKVKLLRSRLADTDIRGEPGRIYRIRGGEVLVCAADRCLWLTRAVFADDGESLTARAQRYDRLATVAEASLRILSTIQ